MSSVPFFSLYLPDWISTPFHPEPSRALTFTKRLFGCLYARNGGCKINRSMAIYLRLHIRQKYPYLAVQARVGLVAWDWVYGHSKAAMCCVDSK